MNEWAPLELDLRELRLLDVLLRERSITKTARAIESTQPAVSKTLRHLREQFGDPLFVRNGQAMQPTAKALSIAEQLHSLLQAADGLRSTAIGFDPRRSKRSFSLLLTDVGMIHFLPTLIVRLTAVAPDVRVRAVPLDSRQFETKLETGEADLAIGAFPKAARHLRRQRLYRDGYLGVMRKDHPRRVAACGAGFLGERHVVVTASDIGHAAHGGVQAVLASVIPPSNIMLCVPSFVAAAIVAGCTDAIAVVPAVLARRLATSMALTTFPPPIDLPRIEVAQFWHERFHRDPAHCWLRTISTDLFAESTVRRPIEKAGDGGRTQ